MKRRAFIATLGGAAVWPLAARAQRGDQTRRVGVFMNYPESDAAGQLRATAFRQELEKRGWTVGRNLQIDYRWGVGDADFIRSGVEQLLRPTPDVILAAISLRRSQRRSRWSMVGGRRVRSRSRNTHDGSSEGAVIGMLIAVPSPSSSRAAAVQPCRGGRGCGSWFSPTFAPAISPRRSQRRSR
jgi:hypothetical protein